MRPAKFLWANNNFPDCLQNYHTSILSKIVFVCYQMAFPFDTNSCYHFSVSVFSINTSGTLSFFLQKGQQVCILIPISNDTIQWNESLKMSWWHQYMWSFFAHLFFIVFNEWAGVNHKDCEHCHHFFLLGVKTFFELHLFLWMAIIEIPQ